MSKYRVKGTLITPFSVEVEAESEAAAIERMHEIYEADECKFFENYTDVSELIRTRSKLVQP